MVCETPEYESMHDRDTVSLTLSLSNQLDCHSAALAPRALSMRSCAWCVVALASALQLALAAAGAPRRARVEPFQFYGEYVSGTSTRHVSAGPFQCAMFALELEVEV